MFFLVILYGFNEIFSDLGNCKDRKYIWALFVCFWFEFPICTFTLLFSEEVQPTM